MIDISTPITVSFTAAFNAFNLVWSKKTCTAEKAFEQIRKDTIKTDNPKILYASVGNAEVIALFQRRYEEQVGLHAELPKIGRIVISRMSDATIDALLEQELLPKEFKTSLHANLGKIKSTCSKLKIPLEVSFWPKLPTFHGFIYGNKAYIGQWIVGPFGYLSHDTHLHTLSGKKNARTINELISATFSIQP